MISFSNINKQYGKQFLFVDASFQLNPGEKVGLVGPNGAGKTTLFRMVVGEETPDEGAVSVPKKLTIGYFRQDVEEMLGRSVLDEAIAGSGRVGDLHHELEALQREMSDPDTADDMERILERFGHVQEEYEHLGGYALESQAREVLHGLGSGVCNSKTIRLTATWALSPADGKCGLRWHGSCSECRMYC
jgi:ATPase subunit of ABC transporter with duplicated ATPase domains